MTFQSTLYSLARCSVKAASAASFPERFLLAILTICDCFVVVWCWVKLSKMDFLLSSIVVGTPLQENFVGSGLLCLSISLAPPELDGPDASFFSGGTRTRAFHPFLGPKVNKGARIRSSTLAPTHHAPDTTPIAAPFAPWHNESRQDALESTSALQTFERAPAEQRLEVGRRRCPPRTFTRSVAHHTAGLGAIAIFCARASAAAAPEHQRSDVPCRDDGVFFARGAVHEPVTRRL